MGAIRNVWLAATLVVTLGIQCPGAEENPPGIYVEPQSGMTFPERDKDQGEKALKAFLSECGKLMRPDAAGARKKAISPSP